MRLERYHDQLWQTVLAERSATRFASFYHATRGQVLGYCSAILQDPAKKQDAAECVFTQLWATIANDAPAQAQPGLIAAQSLPPTAAAALLKFTNREIIRRKQAQDPNVHPKTAVMSIPTAKRAQSDPQNGNEHTHGQASTAQSPKPRDKHTLGHTFKAGEG